MVLLRRNYIRHILVLFIAVFAVGAFVVFPQPAYALFNEMGMVVAHLVSWVVSMIVYVIGQLISLVITLLISLASYNEFINAPAVTIGWLVLRDIANMIVVVLLLVIAVATILSVEEYQYKHLLPRLLIMAVMVNFSKTIVGFLIDASQIVMLTFVAAFREAGAGNFVAALNLEKMLSINPEYTGNAGALEILGGLFLALILMVIALVVLVVMTVIIGFRIVMLWILTVFSPLVFILSSIEAGKEYYAKWWKQLTNYLIVGPVLAFFIWLTLAATGGTPGSDSRAVQTFSRNGGTSYFATSQEQGFITAAGHWQSMIGFLIAISMLIGGLMITEELGVVGSGFARNALEGLKDTGKDILKHAGKGALEVGAWAARKVKAGKLPGGYLKGIDFNPASIYRNIKEQLEEKKHREEKEGYIGAVDRLEKGGLSGMVLGMGSKSWVENYGEGFLMRKGIGKITGAWLHGKTEDHVGKQRDAEKRAGDADIEAGKAQKRLDEVKRYEDLTKEVRLRELGINKANLILNDPHSRAPESVKNNLRAIREKHEIAKIKAENDLAFIQAPTAGERTTLENKVNTATAQAKADRVIAAEEKELGEQSAHYSPQDFEGRKMRRAEVNDRMKKYDTSNEEELVALFNAAHQRGDTFEAAAIAMKAASVGHGNEIVQAVKLEKGDLEKYGKDDMGNDRVHPNGQKYKEGDTLSCDVDGLSIMINKIFRDKLKMGAQEAYGLQSDMSAKLEALGSRWLNLAQSVGASPDGKLRQRTRAEQMYAMGIEQDKVDFEGLFRNMGRGGYGGEMYNDPKDPSSGRAVFLDERMLRFFADNFAQLKVRGLDQGRMNSSAVMNVMANPANVKILEALGAYLKREGKDIQNFNKTDINYSEFLAALKEMGRSSRATAREVAGAGAAMKRTMSEVAAVRRGVL